MTATVKRTLEAALPLRPHELVDVGPLDRGKLYNDLDLDSWQRACVEGALRMVKAGTYESQVGS